MRIIYGSRDMNVKMVNKKCTCLFHWTLSFDRHTKQLIKPKLQDQHKAFYYEYKNTMSLEEVAIQYATIYCWLLSSNTLCETRIHKFNN
jgi:hypothetical protein